MNKTKDIAQSMNKEILKGSKKLYSTSQPVLRVEDGKYYIAMYGFPYTFRDIQKFSVERPSIYAIADVETGKVVKKYDCKTEKDFSTATHDRKYSIMTKKKLRISKEFYNSVYDLFDKIREELIETGELNRELYAEYMRKLLSNVSEDYEKFYTDLSVDVDAKYIPEYAASPSEQLID